MFSLGLISGASRIKNVGQHCGAKKKVEVNHIVYPA